MCYKGVKYTLPCLILKNQMKQNFLGIKLFLPFVHRIRNNKAFLKKLILVYEASYGIKVQLT